MPTGQIKRKNSYNMYTPLHSSQLVQNDLFLFHEDESNDDNYDILHNITHEMSRQFRYCLKVKSTEDTSLIIIIITMTLVKRCKVGICRVALSDEKNHVAKRKQKSDGKGQCSV